MSNFLLPSFFPRSMDLSFFGIAYGKYGDTAPSSLPTGMTQKLTTSETGGGSYTPHTWIPNYNQSISSQYPNSGQFTNFFYIPFPAWQDFYNITNLSDHSLGDYSIINDCLYNNYIAGNPNVVEWGNLVLNIKNIIMDRISYNSDGSVSANYNTFDMTEMTISVVPTAYRYDVESNYLETININVNPLVFTSIPNKNSDFNLPIQIGVEHSPPATNPAVKVPAPCPA